MYVPASDALASWTGPDEDRTEMVIYWPTRKVNSEPAESGDDAGIDSTV